MWKKYTVMNAMTLLRATLKITTTSIRSRYLWTGHVLDGNPPSNSLSSNHTVIITPLHTTDEYTHENVDYDLYVENSRFTLLHETSHQLGTPDHYCKKDQDETGTEDCSNINCTLCRENRYPPSCIMTSRLDMANTPTSDLYCTNCIQDIEQHISDHH